MGKTTVNRAHDIECAADQCDRTSESRGYCNMHYKRLRKAGELTLVNHRQNGVCAVDGCDIDAEVRGWCRTHYTRYIRSGTVVDPVYEPIRCAVPGCNERSIGHEMCSKHYYRYMRHGDVGYVSRAECGSGHLGDNGYLYVTRHGHPMATKSGSALAHRVVLYDEIGPDPHPCHWCGRLLEWHDLTVDHLNWIRTDNDPRNLVPSCLPCNSARLRVPSNAKLTESDVREIRASDEPPRILAARFGIDRTHVHAIRSRRSWRSVA